MKRFVFVGILVIGMLCVFTSLGTSVSQTGVTLYFTDAQVMKLIPVRMAIPETTAELQAKIVIGELIKGRDENMSIRRTIPKVRNGITVRVENEIAYVNIKKEIQKQHREGRDLELLTVYSIVNSLTSIDGITCVRFTIDGKQQKDFMGYIDMRETFIPDYMI
ncbi:MAG: GerMN domain-containing protein [Clostridiales bacterium]|nr:GerMN domain-containing protein [Clostridiales bacterium]